MIMPGSKKPTGLIVATMNKNAHMSEGGEVKNEVALDVKDSALQSHAQDMITAMHNKSPSELVSAMKNFLEEHDLHEEQEEGEPSEAVPSK